MLGAFDSLQNLKAMLTTKLNKAKPKNANNSNEKTINALKDIIRIATWHLDKETKKYNEQSIGNYSVEIEKMRHNFEYKNKIKDDILREKYQLPSQYLELEITESAYTEDPEQIITITRQLREAGFVILMDDFGTGYSSLNMLKDIQIDVLKLDMGFLKSSDHSAKGGNILTAILKMAESLKMQAIAEGVETKEQVEFLKSIGCRYVQGFYYSKPLPVGEFEKLI